MDEAIPKKIELSLSSLIPLLALKTVTRRNEQSMSVYSVVSKLCIGSRVVHNLFQLFAFNRFIKSSTVAIHSI